MKRRELLKSMGLTAGAVVAGNMAAVASETASIPKKKRALRVAHITDVHMRPELDAPARFKKCLEEIKRHKVDFFLNGGDTIYAADYGNITRERVNVQWDIWHQLRDEFSEYEMHSCLGNHDMWWAAPDNKDPMYGKDYVVKQLGIPNRYYSIDKKGWHFIILDSNNKNAGSLDEEQRKWLEGDLGKLATGEPVLIMSHYPLLAACTNLDGGGMHTDYKYLVDLFYQHKDKVKACISGHIHLQDSVTYNGVQYCCNGALSGFWWEEGDKSSAGKCWVQQTPPGYTIIDLYEDGAVENRYIPHSY
ncbi:MAG: metallophosphoesterase [Sphingobacteriales bacterium 50-39]|nr:metallophosphoesterase [Sphingobacteriales bacterium]OJW54110.1 MAG: metallophosphoesterase [Sphingobacteriales bacterium 50-39]